MKRFSICLVVALSLILTGSALAGDYHEKCTEGTQACLNQLAAKIQKKAWLGVELEKAEEAGYTITKVIADSPAEAAGFRAGDVLVALNGITIAEENHEALKKAKMSLEPGSTASYTVKRQGAKQQLAVTLSHVPATVMAEWIGEHMVEHHAVIAAK